MYDFMNYSVNPHRFYNTELDEYGAVSMLDGPLNGGALRITLRMVVSIVDLLYGNTQ